MQPIIRPRGTILLSSLRVLVQLRDQSAGATFSGLKAIVNNNDDDEFKLALKSLLVKCSSEDLLFGIDSSEELVLTEHSDWKGDPPFFFSPV